MKGQASVRCDGAAGAGARQGTASPLGAHGRGLDGVGARGSDAGETTTTAEVTTTTRARPARESERTRTGDATTTTAEVTTTTRTKARGARKNETRGRTGLRPAEIVVADRQK
jgi:hypothetical protein